METTKITGITALRDDLLDYYVQARNGQIKPKDVGHISQLAGKIIQSARAQIQYNEFMETKKEIPFLEK